jgi:hypothetical protein
MSLVPLSRSRVRRGGALHAMHSSLILTALSGQRHRKTDVHEIEMIDDSLTTLVPSIFDLVVRRACHNINEQSFDHLVFCTLLHSFQANCPVRQLNDAAAALGPAWATMICYRRCGTCLGLSRFSLESAGDLRRLRFPCIWALRSNLAVLSVARMSINNKFKDSMPMKIHDLPAYILWTSFWLGRRSVESLMLLMCSPLRHACEDGRSKRSTIPRNCERRFIRLIHRTASSVWLTPRLSRCLWNHRKCAREGVQGQSIATT